MTVADDVLRAVGAWPEGMTDAELAALLQKRHQHINQVCNRLANQGLIVRDGSSGQILNRITGQSAPPPLHQKPSPAASQGEEWSWEGGVQSKVVTHLARTGWNIVAVANTAQRERGVDIIAEKDEQRLVVEVKGWPSTTYARGDRAGQPKPTQPSTQAGVWFSEGLTTLIRRGAQPETRLALALPDKPRYRALLGEAGWALDRLDITVYLVTADGSVQEREREN